jgi:hypothetical protein
MLVVEGQGTSNHPIVLTEFGGIAFSPKHEGVWGYSQAKTAQEFLERYRALMQTVTSLPALAGFCYTQLADTFQEANGLVFADRTPKAAAEQIALATTGAERENAAPEESAFRERMMDSQR